MRAVPFESVEWTPSAGQRSRNTKTKYLLRGKPGSPDNYELFWGHYGENGSFSPRHRHNFDQFRFAIKNPLNFAPGKDIPLGQIAYFPEGAYYGPQQSLEGNYLFIIQFGGATGHGYCAQSEVKRAVGELSKEGEFAKGVYTRYEGDTKINKDAFEAVWEHLTGRKVEYPKPRQDFPIIIDPEAYQWLPVAGSPGISTRHFGTFNERGTAAFQYRVDKGAQARLQAEPAIRLLVVYSGWIGVGGRDYGPLDAMEIAAGEEVTIQGDEDAIVTGVRMPDFSDMAQGRRAA